MTTSFALQTADISNFRDQGYFVARGLLSSDEVEALCAVTELSMLDGLDLLDRHDAEGYSTKLALRNALGDDAYSALVQCERIVDTVEALLGGEVYHYHHKVMIKEPLVGGAWEWHQDYGYWYENGCLRPDMASCLIAITAATEENGCVEVVPGSHLLGRLNHVSVDDQVCADPERVAVALGRYRSEPVVMEPGDAAFFHCNLLHRSQRNTSSLPRLSLINCYNTKENDPFIEHHHPRYSPLDRVADEELLPALRRHSARAQKRPSSE